MQIEREGQLINVFIARNSGFSNVEKKRLLVNCFLMLLGTSDFACVAARQTVSDVNQQIWPFIDVGVVAMIIFSKLNLFLAK